MERLGRWLYNGLAALSLALCLATVTVWVWTDLDRGANLSILNPRNLNIAAFDGTIMYVGPPHKTLSVAADLPADLRAASAGMNFPSTLLVRCRTAALFTAIFPAIWLILRLDGSVFNALAATSLLIMLYPILRIISFHPPPPPPPLPPDTQTSDGVWQFYYRAPPPSTHQYWFALALLAILPALWTVIHLARKKENSD